MGKHGPCCHCGVTTTPLWRNGPPNKPVLCNACGSRWRTKGSLADYTPLHARELFDSKEYKVPIARNISFKPKEKTLIKIKQIGYAVENEREMPCSDQNFRKSLDVDTSNRTSSGSAISYSESCVQFGMTEASDVTGSAQSNAWETVVPSKKMTCVTRLRPTRLEPSPVEKLAKDLYSIWHEQQSSYISSGEEDLLYDSPIPTGSLEIGNGSVLIRYPNQKNVEEESEASSLPRDNKSYMTYETYSGSTSFPFHSENKGTVFSAVANGKPKKSAVYEAQEKAKRDRSSSDKLHIPRDTYSQLAFTGQKIFLKEVECKQDIGGKGVATELNVLGHSSLPTLKRPRNIQNQHVPESRGNMRSPKRASKSGGSGTNLPSTVTLHPNSSNTDAKSVHDAEFIDDENGSCMSPRSFFATPPDQSSMLCSLPFTGDSCAIADGDDSLSKFSASSYSTEQPSRRQ